MAKSWWAEDFKTWNGSVRSCLVRLNGDGSLDTSLANFDGAVDFFTDSNGNLFSSVEDVALQPTGAAPHFRIIVGGSFYRPFASGGFHYGIVALKAADGTRDSGFNVVYGAHVAGNELSGDNVKALALQPDGKVIVGGTFGGFNNVDTNMLVRLTNTGSNDTSFVNNLGDGLQPALPASYHDVLDLLVQNDGKIVVGGAFDTASGFQPSRHGALLGGGGARHLVCAASRTVVGRAKAFPSSRMARWWWA